LSYLRRERLLDVLYPDPLGRLTDEAVNYDPQGFGASTPFGYWQDRWLSLWNNYAYVQMIAEANAIIDEITYYNPLITPTNAPHVLNHYWYTGNASNGLLDLSQFKINGELRFWIMPDIYCGNVLEIQLWDWREGEAYSNEMVLQISIFPGSSTPYYLAVPMASFQPAPSNQSTFDWTQIQITTFACVASYLSKLAIIKPHWWTATGTYPFLNIRSYDQDMKSHYANNAVMLRVGSIENYYPVPYAQPVSPFVGTLTAVEVQGRTFVKWKKPDNSYVETKTIDVDHQISEAYEVHWNISKGNGGINPTLIALGIGGIALLGYTAYKYL